jgi:hypothetical protein
LSILRKIQKPSRASGTVSLLFGLAAGFFGVFGVRAACAQANSIEESGVTEKRAAAAIDDKAFDCGAFRRTIGAASGGFATLRGEKKTDGETMTVYAANAPLFGSCEILDKKKVGEISYSCQAGKLTLADLKATVEACLGDKAFGLASNENPNTPFLRYSPDVDGAKARVIALTTFGKTTLAIFNLR